MNTNQLRVCTVGFLFCGGFFFWEIHGIIVSLEYKLRARSREKHECVERKREQVPSQAHTVLSIIFRLGVPAWVQAQPAYGRDDS